MPMNVTAMPLSDRGFAHDNQPGRLDGVTS